MSRALAQIGNIPQPTRFPSVSVTSFDTGSGFFLPLPLQIIAGAAIGALVFAVLLHVLRWWLRRRNIVPKKLHMRVLLVTVAKDSSDEAEKTESIDEIRQQIAVAEAWLSALGGLRAQRGFFRWLFGRTDHFSFEIVAQNGQISFYVVVPEYMQSYMEQQILAQYPDAQVMEVEDYNIFSPTSVVLSGYLSFTREHIFPINTYAKLTSDPLNALTNSLSGVAHTDGVAIQVIARSAHKRWHRRGMHVASHVQKGKSVNEALEESSHSLLSFPAKLVKIFQVKSKEQIEHERGTNNSKTPSPMEQELIKGLEQKTSKAGLDCNIRIVVAARSEHLAQQYLSNVVNSFAQFNFYQYGNSLKPVEVKPTKLVPDFIYRNYVDHQGVLLNTEELASVFHFPTPFLDTPNIRWLAARKLPAPADVLPDGVLLGQNVYRGVTTDIRLAPGDRQRHAYIIGMTGTGKSVLMANMAIQDIREGKGVCVVDPHGSLVESILESIPPERIEDVIYFNPSDTDRPIGLNMLEAATPQEQDFVTQEMIAIFYKLVTDPSMIGPMFEHNMRNAMLTLMADEQDPGTIVEIPRMFTDKEFQATKVANVHDPMVRSFWEQEMAKTSDFHKSEMLGYLISKVGRFVENSMIRNIIGQPTSGINCRKIMDEGKILLVNLSKGTVGEINSNLLGLIIVSKLQLAALARSDMPEHLRRDFYLYIDEFQNFITDSIATILAEARKYKLNLILAHQYIGQLTGGAGVEGKSYGDKIKDSIFGNVGTLMSFRIGIEDAELMAKQFAPVVNEYDLTNIERYHAYVRLLVNNSPSRPFTMKTMAPAAGSATVAQDIKDFSRWKYGREVTQVEADIMRRSQLGKVIPAQPPAVGERPL